MRAVLVLLMSLFLISCAGMSEQECTTMNWYKKGISDAKAGLPPSTYGAHKETCLRFGISFDKDAYIDGYESVKNK